MCLYIQFPNLKIDRTELKLKIISSWRSCISSGSNSLQKVCNKILILKTHFWPIVLSESLHIPDCVDTAFLSWNNFRLNKKFVSEVFCVYTYCFLVGRTSMFYYDRACMFNVFSLHNIQKIFFTLSYNLKIILKDFDLVPKPNLDLHIGLRHNYLQNRK